MSARRARHGDGALAPAAAVAVALSIAGCGSGQTRHAAAAGPSTASAAAPVAVKWEPAFTAGSGRARALLSRRSRRIQVEVVQPVCHPSDPRLADPAARVTRVAVGLRRYAVVVTVLMRPLPGQSAADASGCTPANVAFPLTVSLPRPLGPRALVDGGSPRFGERPGTQPRIRVPASDAALERAAEAVYGPPDGGVTP